MFFHDTMLEGYQTHASAAEPEFLIDTLQCSLSRLESTEKKKKKNGKKNYGSVWRQSKPSIFLNGTEAGEQLTHEQACHRQPKINEHHQAFKLAFILYSRQLILGFPDTDRTRNRQQTHQNLGFRYQQQKSGIG